MVRKILHLAERVGFQWPVSKEVLAERLNQRFNAYTKKAHPNYVRKHYFEAETTKGKSKLKVERDLFRLDEQRLATAVA